MYFRLCLSPIEKLRRGECKIQFYRDVECVSDCIDLLLDAPLGRAPNPVPQG